jgi:cytosine/adenosine deaminase-related metal-dependent hydrolase
MRLFERVQPLTIKGAAVYTSQIGAWQFEKRDLYAAERILDKPARNAIEVDLNGYTIFPGLINAHDHLELNHYPRTKFHEVYNNAHEWGEDVNKHLNETPFKELRAYPIWDRLFIGGLKNILSGVTTVAHHNTLYRILKRPDFPVRVLQKYGWAHSLHFSREEDIMRSYKVTPPNASWFIHLAEGTDEIAASEYKRLKKLGCVSKNTVIVHGVGMTREDIADAAQHIRGLAWCPSTNYYLLNKTVPMSMGYHKGDWRAEEVNVALGSDSRLTADGDLLDEMQAAGKALCDMACVWEAVTHRAAYVLGQHDIGHLNVMWIALRCPSLYAAACRKSAAPTSWRASRTSRLCASPSTAYPKLSTLNSRGRSASVS